MIFKTLKKRRKIILGLRELGLDVEIPRGPNYKTTYMRELYRNQKLLDLLEQMECEKTRIREIYRKKVRSLITV